MPKKPVGQRTHRISIERSKTAAGRSNEKRVRKSTGKPKRSYGHGKMPKMVYMSKNKSPKKPKGIQKVNRDEVESYISQGWHPLKRELVRKVLNKQA
jgi:hypothetical protein